MSQKREKKKRQNERMEFTREYNKWLEREPKWWRIFKHRKWLSQKPKRKEVEA